MQPDASKLLADVRDAGEFILELTRPQSSSIEYSENRLVRQACERNFEVIGEAINRLRRLDAATADRLGDVRQIIAFRNILSHGYDHIDHEIVWDVIKNKLPALLTLVNKAAQSS